MIDLKKVLYVLACAIAFLGAQTVSAQLLIDFNSTTQDAGPHNETGFQAYDAGHEVASDFTTKTYSVVFSTGAATVTVTPNWPNTIDNRVQQMIDRGAGLDVNWVGNNIDLLTDWIGSDTRTGNGGNGDWDRTGGTTATYMTLTLVGLPVGLYTWVSYHHDTENIWSDFQVEISTDGGATFGSPTDLEMTSSSPGGSPANPFPSTGSSDPDPRNLPSTFTTSFTADGTNDIVLRFAPFVDGIDPVGMHKQFFGMNGFELDLVQQTPPDFGDAPASYGTAGATQIFVDLFLGVCADGESAAQTSSNADGDDTNTGGAPLDTVGTCVGSDDEDGINFDTPVVPGQNAGISVTTGPLGCALSGWYDFNADGDFADADERIFADVVVGPGTTALNFAVPAGAVQATTFARFRCCRSASIAECQAPTGSMLSGEVEDYQIGTVPVELQAFTIE